MKYMGEKMVANYTQNKKITTIGNKKGRNLFVEKLEKTFLDPF